ncbi:error-prone DNA polymerase [Corynebacterium pygosceleis]|uniref:Error-prone DNA polymerase n=1 Tax=Corynebacterium pygosceleis TaxID=2800406 RepID=A0A9Q4GL65_9CORY|nr:error-prone DNA polymerase [Corynebacterium pygosceleis]MCK7637606.1 error-prone DNA polymerase [Corynebacterium pygosceleis]MCL0119614.1 error-prone DNA polymerase [Corynebacterium pygosceleis]MCX7468065.1 error-prone DNA polymerase [Corynebacterium pygosceleis]
MEWSGGEVGFNGLPMDWRTLEKVLSGGVAGGVVDASDGRETGDDGEKVREFGSGPSRSHPFAELRARSSYSFLSGASDPGRLVERALELGLVALGVTDRDGFYAVVRFAEAAAGTGLATVFGAELTLGDGEILCVLCRGADGYRRLSHTITDAHMAAGSGGAPVYPPLPLLGEHAAGTWQILADITWIDRLGELVDAFGPGQVAVQLSWTMSPGDVDANERLSSAAEQLGLRTVVSTMPLAATRHDAHVAGAKHALRLRSALADTEPVLHPLGGTWLRGAADIERALPGSGQLRRTTVEVATECAFTLDLLAPELPRRDAPDGHTEMSWLRDLTLRRARKRYAGRPRELRPVVRAQLEHELGVIEHLNFPGYFLIICDLVDFCRDRGILCQGRGSAANSAVCFALGITNVEPVGAGLLFERFLSPERDGPPDIDLDIESTRREEVIQYVYTRYGRDNAAQVANVITYRRRSALRDAGRALGHPQGACDAWAKGTAEPPADVLALAERFTGQPRHLGIHSGGMVICDRPLADVVPVEWARKENRSVVQWDKDDCAAAGLVKFDLLGLGMLEALHHMIDLVAEHRGETVNLWELDPDDPEVYAMLARADAVGVFQVESRAQMSTLPRLKPREFFDLVVEVALIRPGPIQGGSVHPYIRRRNGEEPVTYDHPCLEPALAKTLGVPLFQEQLMQMARDAAGFTGAEADALRRAMGSRRSPERMARIRDRFFTGLEEKNGITGDVAENLWNKMVAFSAYGFPESHSQSFASLVYFSAWFKYHYPAEFCTGLLRAQPMGFYSPQSLIADARRHGVPVDPVSVNDSGITADCPGGRIRLGLDLVRGVGEGAVRRILAARTTGGPFTGIVDLARRADLSVPQTEALARAGATDCLGVDRRRARWEAGVAATEKEGMLPGISGVTAPALPGMTTFELLATDISATGVTHDRQPVALLRSVLDARGIIPADRLPGQRDGTRIRVAGIITHRQRPRTAGGVTFLGMEDETGLMNVIVPPGLWSRQRVLARTAHALIVRGIVQNASGAVAVLADLLEPFPVAEAFSTGSRDFR